MHGPSDKSLPTLTRDLNHHYTWTHCERKHFPTYRHITALQHGALVHYWSIHLIQRIAGTSETLLKYLVAPIH